MPLGCELPYELPLNRHFPGTSSLSSVAIAQLPTPVEALDPDAVGVAGVSRLWVKRDDISGPRYGGNKVRKLEFLLAQALEQGCRSVITFGALGSNHVLATAMYGAELGLQVHAVLTPQRMTAYLAANVAGDLAAGATLHPADSLRSAVHVAAGLRGRLREQDGVEPMVIPFGGTCSVSHAAFVNAACELAEQVQRGELLEPDLLFVALGSGGTAIPLAAGLRALGLATRVVAIRVVPEDVSTGEMLREIAVSTSAHMRSVDDTFPDLGFEDLAIDVRGEFIGSGYADPTPEAVAACDVAKGVGLALETTYTGKALAALRADRATGRLRGANVLFWNTYSSRRPDADPRGLSPDLQRLVLDDRGGVG